MEEKEGKILAVINATVVRDEGKNQVICQIHGEKQLIRAVLVELLRPFEYDFMELIKDAKDSRLHN